ncbi:hypothetical protein AHAS_Ahas07G0062400 [Arachis hypogaea]
MLHTNKDAMDMARIGMRDNMVELFVVHKEGAIARKGCTIEEVQEIDGDEPAAPTTGTVRPGPIMLHKAQSSAQAKVDKKPKVVTEAQSDMSEDDSMSLERSDFSGDDESKDDDYQPKNDDAIDEGDSDEQWSENSAGDSAMEVAFDDSDDDWNAERVQGEFSASVNKEKEKVVAAGLRDEDEEYESEELWDVPTKAARVKQQALDEINSIYGEQYRRIHDYAAKLPRSNLGTTVRIQVQRPPEFQLETPIPGNDLRSRFERIYICLDTCKMNFMVCIPMIGLDGCFIKTPYVGQLLTAIRWDPNDQTLLIAYVIVEAETKDSCT